MYTAIRCIDSYEVCIQQNGKYVLQIPYLSCRHKKIDLKTSILFSEQNPLIYLFANCIKAFHSMQIYDV